MLLIFQKVGIEVVVEVVLAVVVVNLAGIVVLKVALLYFSFDRTLLCLSMTNLSI
jgi:hypothetical protein